MDRATQIERIHHRCTRAPDETFVMTEADLDRWRGQFDVPDAAELGVRLLTHHRDGRGALAGLNGLQSAGRRYQTDNRSLRALSSISLSFPGCRNARSYRRSSALVQAPTFATHFGLRAQDCPAIPLFTIGRAR